MNPSPENFVQFVTGEPPRLDLFAAERAQQPITPYLLGKFTEHLGRNIYRGMWAQILVNPGFEPHFPFVWDDSTPRAALAEHFARGPLSPGEAQALLDRLEEALPRGVAFGWMPD